MIIKSLTKIPLQPTDETEIHAVLPVKAGLVLPGSRRRYHINRKSSLKLIEEARKSDSLVALSYSPTPRELADGEVIPLCEIGTLARIVSVRDARGANKDVEFEALERVALHQVTKDSPYIKAETRRILEGKGPSGAARDKSVAEIIDLCEKITQRGTGIDPKLGEVIRAEYSDDGRFADTVATHAPFSPNERQTLLEAVGVKDRLKLLQDLLQRELDRIMLSIQLGHRAEEEMQENRRREFLELKLEEIKKQLGGAYADERASSALKRRINLATHLPDEVRQLAWEETSRLAILPIGAAEYAAVKHHVETLLSLPWGRHKEDEVNQKRLEESILSEYYGSDTMKAKVCERITSNIYTGGAEKGPIICFMGPSGTGKATLAKAIASGLNREFIRLSVGSILFIPEIKGTNRSMVGATPGIFIRAMQEAKSSNPVIYIEDLEYLTEGGDSSLALALLEVMDPRLNSKFVDNYLGLPFDFSDALFICAVRYPDGIPESIDHRFEPIEISGYIESEKVSIARKHLAPGMLKNYKLTRSEVSITNESLIELIRHYTMESGIQELARLLDRLIRYIASRRRTGRKKSWKLDSKLMEEALGPPIFIPEKPAKEPEIGVATGLAWTGAGGELMLIESLKMRGDGNIVFTGSLGEVMRESIQAAHSYIRSKSDMLGIDHDDFKSFDIHVHFPSGAIPKDGPSAGLAVSLVIASIMAERPIRNDIAMTGEVTLRGKVLPVGGVREKCAAAHRAGIPIVVLPRENEKDLNDLPKEITRETKFVFVSSVDELFEQALLDFTPSAHTLEKLFAVELEKARRKRSARNRTKRKRS